MTSRTATALRHMREVDWSALAGLGNVLRHEYQRVDPGLLWTLLTDELATLSSALRRIEERTRREA